METKQSKPLSPRQQARNYVGAGQLRQVLEMHGHLHDDVIEEVVKAACWALNA